MSEGPRENELLARIAQVSSGLSSRFPQVLIGPGDDCALVSSPVRTLLKVDQVIEGRHFTPGTPLDLIARKAIARPVSDIAAMAGTPSAALAAAILPADERRAADLFDACARWAEHFGCPIVGGDISLTAPRADGGRLSLSISVAGEPHSTRGPVLRAAAQPGDRVYVTGALGGSFDPATGLGRHLTFEPRIAEARWLASALGSSLHAMMDLSDGLGLDGARLAKASGVRLVLDADRTPRAAGVADWTRAFADGEDYELLFTAAAEALVPGVIPGVGTAVTEIGTVEAGSGCVAIVDGRPVDVSTLGFEHRAKNPA